MNDLDKKLYELFSPYDVELDGIVEEVQLHDVFRVADEKRIIIDKISFGYRDWATIWTDVGYVEFNPTLPLLQQSNETKSQLISLFS